MAVKKWGEGGKDQTRKEVKAVRSGSSDFSRAGAGCCCSTGHHYAADVLQTHLPCAFCPAMKP